MRLRIEGNRREGRHNVYPGSGPLDGGKNLTSCLIDLDDMSITRVDLPRDRVG